MADYEAYGPWVGGDDWRAWVGVYITTNNNTTLAGRVESWVWSQYGTTLGNANIKGAAAWDNGAWQYGSATSISENSWKKLSTMTFSVAKGHSATNKTAWAKAEGIAGIYSGSSSQATVSVTVGAKPSYAVKYNANGGSGAPSSQTKWYGETLTLSSTKPTRTNYTFKGWATSASGGVSYASGASYTANSAITLYAVWARAYTVPNPPTSVTATRTSDAVLGVTWTNNSAIPRDYANLYVYLQTDAGSYAQVAKLGATATNYTWSGAQPNKRYQFAVRAWNSAGYSSYAYSGYAYTTPAVPASVSATKATVSTVDVTVTAGATWATSHEVERTSDEGATWSPIGTVAGAGGTYTDTNPPAGSVQYRARAVIGALYSDYVNSNSLVTLTPPLAPTLSSYPPAAMLAGSAAFVSWIPNHPDGTEQAKAQVEVTTGGTTTTIAINDSTTTVDLSSYVAAPANVSVRVRTYGLYAAWGAWSDTISFTAYDAPVVTIDAPAYDGEVMTALPVSVQWTATDTTGISSQVLRLFDGNGALLKSWTLAGNVSQFDLDQSTYFLANNSVYSVVVTVTAGSTLQASATRQFDVAYVGPGEPTFDIWWGEDSLACAITVGDGDDQGGTLPTADYFYVVRVMPDGTEYLVATNLASSEQAYDPLPPLGVEFAYRVVAVAASGTETPTLAPTAKGTNAWAFGFGAGVAETALLIASPSAQSSWQHGGEAYHFADGTGETLPVFYGVGTLDVAHSWSFVIPKKWRDTAEDVQRLFRQHATCWVRDPFGHRWYVAAKATVKVSPGPKWDVSVTAEEMRFKEG